MEWVTKKNKIMHRVLQVFIYLGGAFGIVFFMLFVNGQTYSGLFKAFHYYDPTYTWKTYYPWEYPGNWKNLSYKQYLLLVKVWKQRGFSYLTKGLITGDAHAYTSSYKDYKLFLKWEWKPWELMAIGWSLLAGPNPPESLTKFEYWNLMRYLRKNWKQHDWVIKKYGEPKRERVTNDYSEWVPDGIKQGLFSLTLIGSFGFFVFLVWTVRIRKFTPEEKRFKRKIKELEGKICRLKEKELLSEKEEMQLQQKRKKIFKEFVSRFSTNRRRPLEYKIERLSVLKEEGIISEGEFDEGKAKLIEELK